MTKTMTINEVIEDVLELIKLTGKKRFEIQVLEDGKQIEYSSDECPVETFLALHKNYDFRSVRVGKGQSGIKLVANVVVRVA